MSKRQYYVLHVVGDVEPHVHGPYTSAAKQLDAARALRRAEGHAENGIYAAMVKDGTLCVEAYCGGALDAADEV